MDGPASVKGAQAVAACVFLARTGSSKSEVRDYITGRFNYRLDDTIDRIRWAYSFDSSCQVSVPQAIIAALESTHWENAVRLTVSLGDDCDTLASIAGAIASAIYGGVPTGIAEQARSRLDEHLTGILDAFTEMYC